MITLMLKTFPVFQHIFRTPVQVHA